MCEDSAMRVNRLAHGEGVLSELNRLLGWLYQRKG